MDVVFNLHQTHGRCSFRRIVMVLRQTALLCTVLNRAISSSMQTPRTTAREFTFGLAVRFCVGAAVDRVAPIQEATGYSARRFTILFQQAVGLSPKRFCRILRLRAVAEQVARGARIERCLLAS
jgi:AraC-like DNA-binding protein